METVKEIMNQKQYTFSNKDKKFLVSLMFAHFGFVLMTISFYGFYYKTQTADCRRLNKKLELAEWAQGEMNKAKAEHKIESIKDSYNNQGISAEEF